MKLTAKLAYTQLKINKRRTYWTLLGIALATALIVTIYSLMASGVGLIQELLEDATYDRFLDILIFSGVAVLLNIIVISASVIVVSNSFRVSAGERMAQFGILKSVGATKKQIARTVLYEGLFLSAIGLPAGILLGLLVDVLGLQVANFYLGELASTGERAYTLHFILAWWAILISVVFSFGMVLLSAWLPARKASKIPAILAIRKIGEVKANEKPLPVNPLVEKLFGVEGVLASKSIQRSRRNFRATVTSLTISILLFILASSVGVQAAKVSSMLYPEMNANVVGSFYTVTETVGEHGELSPVDSPALIDTALANRITAKYLEFPDTSVFGVGGNDFAYDVTLPKETLTQTMREWYSIYETREKYDLPVVLITLDEEHYSQICQQAGVPLGSNILVNYKKDSIRKSLDNMDVWLTEFAPYVFDGQTLHLHPREDITGSSTSLSIPMELPLHGQITENISAEIQYASNGNVVIIVPSLDTINYYYWFSNTADPYNFTSFAQSILQDLLPSQDHNEHPALINVSNVQGSDDTLSIISHLITVFIYGFVGMLTLIGLTNVISTLSANIRLRSREFAVLRSVGITQDSLGRMLDLESLLISVRSLILGLPLGVGISYLIHLLIFRSMRLDYDFPWMAILQCIIGVFVVTWLTMRYSASRLRNENIIETIRSENV